MRKKDPLTIAAVSLLITFSITGCTQFRPQNALPPVASDVHARSDLPVHWRGDSNADKLVDAHIQDLLTKTLSEDQAVEIALLRNPALQARYESLGIAEADFVQAGLLKNPALTVQPLWPGRPSVPMEIDFVEEFLDLLYLPLRQKVAAAEFARVRAEVAADVLKSAATTRIAYQRTVAAEASIPLRESMAESTAIAADVAKRLHDAGNFTTLEKARIDAAAEQSQLDLADAKTQAAEARLDLAAQLALPSGATFKIESTIATPPAETWTSDQLESLALAERLDLAAARANVAAIEAQGNLAHAGAPLLEGGNLGVKVDRDTDGNFSAGPSITVPVPIFDQGQASVGKAEAHWREARAELDAKENETRSQVAKALNQFNAARIRATRINQVIVPLRENITAQVQLEYNGMLVGIFDLLSAKHDELEAKTNALTAQQDYWIARIQLESAIGTHLPAPTQASTQPTTQSAIATPPLTK